MRAATSMTRFLRQPDFDRVAHIYRWAEYLTLGPLLQQTRAAHMAKLAACRHALLFGEGDGRFLARLLSRNPQVRATVVDLSEAMLQILRKRCGRALPTAAARLRTFAGSALEAEIPPSTDLVVTHFFF